MQESEREREKEERLKKCQMYTCVAALLTHQVATKRENKKTTIQIQHISEQSKCVVMY